MTQGGVKRKNLQGARCVANHTVSITMISRGKRTRTVVV